MTEQEHLQAIKTKCQALLAIAEKRTAGEWQVVFKTRTTGAYTFTESHLPFLKAGTHVIGEGWELEEREADDFDFCASCAGAAEAGWRATIAFIDAILPFVREGVVKPELPNSIIAAWPEELLS
jgi:hypothetical protein